MQQSLVFLSEHTVMIHPCSSHWYSSQNTLSRSIHAAVTGIPLTTGCDAALMIHLCTSHSHTNSAMIHLCSSHWYSSQNRLPWSIRTAVTGLPPRTGCHGEFIITTHYKARMSWSTCALVVVIPVVSLSTYAPVMIQPCISYCFTCRIEQEFHSSPMHQSLFYLPHRTRASWFTNASVSLPRENFVNLRTIKGSYQRPMTAAWQLEYLLFNYLYMFFLLYSLWN